jgi:hypothetical protein
MGGAYFVGREGDVRGAHHSCGALPAVGAHGGAVATCAGGGAGRARATGEAAAVSGAGGPTATRARGRRGAKSIH